MLANTRTSPPTLGITFTNLTNAFKMTKGSEMESSVQSDVSQLEKLVLKKKAGNSIIRFKPLFSNDSNSIYIIWENSVRKYSTKTGQLVQTLPSASDNPLINLSFHPDNNKYIYGCTNQGEIISWDMESGLLINCKSNVALKNIVTNAIIIAFHFSSDKQLYYTFQKSENTENYYFVNTSYPKFKKKSKTLSISCQANQHSFSFGGKSNKEYLACIKKNKLIVMELDSHKVFIHTVDKSRPFTCVTSHKTELCIATGDCTGRILIWRDILCYPETYSIYHWHTLAVNDIVFTQAGSHFYSGGSENVLVKWTLDMESRVFLPRLHAPIRHLVVASDNQYVALSTEENAVILVDSRTKVVQTIQHLSLGADLGTASEQLALSSVGIVFEPCSKALILNSRPGYLQFLSVATQDLLFKLDVVGQNLLSQERSTVIVNTDVTRVSVSSDGYWLATVEERDDKHSHREVRLKFWKAHWLETFKLHTCIEIPHQGAVRAIQFQPRLVEDELPRAVSSGSDHKFKMWTLLDANMKRAQDESHGSWSCEGVGTHQNLQAGPLAFSSDGSLLAAGFEHSLTLWKPDNTQLDVSLTQPENKEHINHIQFGRAQCCHLLVAASNNQLFVWNLLTLTLSWTVPVSVTCLTSNPMNTHIAAFTDDNYLFVFKPSEIKPLFIQQLKEIKRVVSAVFWPHTVRRPHRCVWQQQAQLLFLTEDQELYGLNESSENIDEEEEEEVVADFSSNSLATHYENAFSAMVAQEIASNVQQARPPPNWAQQLKANEGSYAKLLCQTAAHMLPPMEIIARDLVKEYLQEQAVDVDEVVEETYTTNKWVHLSTNKHTSTPTRNTRKKDLKKVLKENMNWVEQMLDICGNE